MSFMKPSLIKSPNDLALIAQSGAVTAAILKLVAKRAILGTSLQDLDNYTRELIREFAKKFGASIESAFLGYHPYGARRPYPATLCTSVNEVIVHGVPDSYRLRNGDLLKIDFGVRYNGLYSDAALTVPVGAISSRAQHLIEVTREALMRGIAEARAGNHLGDIGAAISGYVREASSGKFGVIKGLTGHGVGYALHEEPSVYNTGTRGKGMRLESGMVLAIEPMISAGSCEVVQHEDDSFATEDGSLSAHFEHTIVITEGDAMILTACNV